MKDTSDLAASRSQAISDVLNIQEGAESILILLNKGEYAAARLVYVELADAFDSLGAETEYLYTPKTQEELRKEYGLPRRD